MDVFGPGSPGLLARAKELATEPEAACWANICAWVPGTGYCRDRDCAAVCFFRAQREAEAARVRRWRRLRRFLPVRSPR